MRHALLSLWFLSAAMLTGCQPASPKPETTTDTPEQAAVRQQFNRLKAAVAAIGEGKAADDSIWDNLSPESRADAEREANAVKAAYAKAADKDKTGMEKQMGLSARELANISGNEYVRSQRFYTAHKQIPQSEVSKITTEGDSATLVFTEPDKSTVTLNLVREPAAGKWRFKLEIPNAPE